MCEFADHKTCLIKAIGTAGIPDEEFENFSRAFQVPASLLGLYPVARRLLDILPLVHEQDVHKHQISSYIRVAEAIADVPDIDIEGFRNCPDNDHPGAFKGLYSTHPLYCLFVHVCSNPLHRKQYAVLLATFIPAYWAWEPKTHDRAYLRGSAGRTVRRMGDFSYRPKGGDGGKIHLPALEAALKWLPVKPTRVHEYAACIEKVIKNIENLGTSEVESNTLSFLYQVFLNVVPGIKEAEQQRIGVHRDGGGGIVGDFLPPLPMVITSSIGGEDEVHVIQEDVRVLGDSENSSEQLKRPPRVEFIVKPRVPVYSARDDYLMILANKHRCEALALDNQMFLFANDTLGPFDIRCLFVELESKTRVGEVDDVVVYLLLAVYVGLPRTEIVRMRLVTTKKVDLAVGPVLRLKQRCVQAQTLSAQQHMRLPKEHQSNRREHASDLEIRLPRAVIDGLAKYCEGNVIDGDGALFRNYEETLQKSKAFLDGINSRCGTRLSLNRVEAIRYVLMANFEDEAAAILGTGRTCDRGYEPATYSVWTHAALDTLSTRTTNHLSDIGGLSKPAWSLTTLKESATSTTSGSRLAPTQEAIKAFVAKQKGKRPSIPPTHAKRS